MAFSSGTDQGDASFRLRTYKVLRSPGFSAGKALPMNQHAWASKQFIALIALALAFAPVLEAAESSPRPPLDEKTRGIERAAALPESPHQSSGAPQLPPQPAAEQQLVAPPEVTYADGQLTIVAENSLLSQVMKALHAALGADIDLPATVADQHIWVHLGPGPARRVVRDLLDGTEFNYVIQASEKSADGILSVLLTQRSNSTGPQTPGSPERAASRIPEPGSEPRNAADSENPARESTASADPSQATPPAPPASGSSNSARLPNAPVSAASSGLSLSPPTEADQQVQTLQSMYQQRRQLQMQQNQKATGQN